MNKITFLLILAVVCMPFVANAQTVIHDARIILPSDGFGNENGSGNGNGNGNGNGSGSGDGNGGVGGNGALGPDGLPLNVLRDADGNPLRDANGNLLLSDVPETGIAITPTSVGILFVLLLLAALITRQMYIVHAEQKKIKKLKRS